MEKYRGHEVDVVMVDDPIDPCTGCGHGHCGALWAQQKKCCPDCSHSPGFATPGQVPDGSIDGVSTDPCPRQHVHGRCPWCGYESETPSELALASHEGR